MHNHGYIKCILINAETSRRGKGRKMHNVYVTQTQWDIMTMQIAHEHEYACLNTDITQ